MSKAIAHAVEDAAKKAEQGLAQDFSKAYHGILKDTEHGATKAADHAAENEARTVDDLAKSAEHPGPTSAHDPHTGGEGGGGHPGGEGPGDEHPDLGAGRPGGGQGTEGNGNCETGGTDPIDVVSGQMLTDATDLELPGLLPLVLRRAYASGYVGGTCFGPGWSATLSQRIRIDRQGIHFAGDDGQILHYPVPTQPGQRVYPQDGARWPLTWDRADDVIRIEDPIAGTTRHFAPRGDVRPLVTVTDRNGHRVDHLYDTYGRPAEVRHSGGYRVAIDTADTASGPRVTALRLLEGPAGGAGTTVKRFGYDERGRLTQVWDAQDAALVLDYDDADRITGWTDTNGHTYRYTYDASGRVVHATGHDGVMRTALDYHPLDRVTILTDAAGHSTRYEYDAHHHVARTTDPLGHTTTTEHDRFGHLLVVTDPLGRTTRFHRDELGQVLRVARADGSLLTVERTELGLPVRVTQPDGSVWSYAWDDRGNLLSITDPSLAATSYAYDAEGRPLTETDALGNTLQIRCNDAGLPTELTDPLGNRLSCIRDSFGRPARIVDALGNTTAYAWTVEGRLSRRIDPDGLAETWHWDGEGNRIAHTNRAGLVTTTGYGPFDVATTHTTADGAVRRLAYDVLLRTTSVTEPTGLTWFYSYDPTGRLTAETDFDGRSTRYTHDAAGQLTSRTNAAGVTTTYRYDVLGNVVEQDTAGLRTTFAWDAMGRLLSARTASSRLDRQLDPNGRVVAETVDGLTLTTVHDPLGRAIRRTTPSGDTTSWSFDAAGSLVGLQALDRTITFGRDALGRETDRHVGEQLRLLSSWDGRHQLVEQSVVASSGAPARRRSFHHRADGLLESVDGWSPEASRILDLDAVGRVTAVRGPSAVLETYVYDGAGNITEASIAREKASVLPETRHYAGTALRSAGRTRYTHDGLGRMSRRVRTTLSGTALTWLFVWDDEDRLIGVVTPEGVRWQYRYDPLGRRIAKERLDADGAVRESTRFTWDGPLLVEQAAKGPQLPGTYAITWAHDGITPVTQTERIRVEAADAGQGLPPAERLFAVVTDPLGTPEELLSVDGSVAWRADRSLWGTTTGSKDSSSTTPLRFPGQYHDPETRLHYNVNRYYDPAAARYLSPDPLGLAGGPNPLLYASNPHEWLDPLGLALCRKGFRLEDGNHKEGWQHIDERHITGNSPKGPGDLMPPSTTRAQVEQAIGRVIKRGTRISDPAKTLQVFEMRMKVNGMRARYRLTVDSKDGNRVITFFPVERSYTP